MGQGRLELWLRYAGCAPKLGVGTLGGRVGGRASGLFSPWHNSRACCSEQSTEHSTQATHIQSPPPNEAGATATGWQVWKSGHLPQWVTKPKFSSKKADRLYLLAYERASKSSQNMGIREILHGFPFFAPK